MTLGRKLGLGLLAAFALVVAGAGFAVYALVPPAPSQEAIRTSVVRDPALVAAAWRLPVAATFASEIRWQSNESVCGPASAANTFRSLGEPARTETDVLAGTGLCWTGFCFLGLTLDQLADVVRAHTKRKVTVLRDLTPEAFEAFEAEMRHANDPGRRYIVNFAREKIFGAGPGHFSPIGGYLASDQLVFVLDVGRAFGPWLIQRDRLYDAMNTYDGDKKRGMLLIE